MDAKRDPQAPSPIDEKIANETQNIMINVIICFSPILWKKILVNLYFLGFLRQIKVHWANHVHLLPVC